MIEVIVEEYLYMHARNVKEFHFHLVKKITSNQKLRKKIIFLN